MIFSIPASIFSVRSLNNLDSSSSEVRLSFRFSASGATRKIHKDQIDLLPHFLCYAILLNLILVPKTSFPLALLTTRFVSWPVHLGNTEWKDSNNLESLERPRIRKKDEMKLDSNELLFLIPIWFLICFLLHDLAWHLI